MTYEYDRKKYAMARKKFTPKSAKSKKKPIEFELYDEVLQASPHMQGVVLLEFIAISADIEEDADEEEQEAQTAEVVTKIMPFFKTALLADSYKKFNNIVRSSDRIVELEDIMEIFSWLLEQYTDERPLDGSSQ